jgi:hypothetical protein
MIKVLDGVGAARVHIHCEHVHTHNTANNQVRAVVDGADQHSAIHMRFMVRN